MIDRTLGAKGRVVGGVYQFGIARAETIKDGGMEVPVAMGSAEAINFQPTGNGKAAITGDFVLTAAEVNPVLRALRQNGIEVTALHNHMLDDQPRLFFMHFWANDDAQKLATGLRAALDKINIAAADRRCSKYDDAANPYPPRPRSCAWRLVTVARRNRRLSPLSARSRLRA